MSYVEGYASFTYRPAPLARRDVVSLDPDFLTLKEANGAPKWRIAWDEVGGAAMVEHTMRGMLMVRFDLQTAGRAADRSFGCNVAAADAADDADFQAFQMAMTAVAFRLASRDPSLPVTIGEYGTVRLALFAFGAVSAVAAGSIAVAAILNGRGAALAGEAMAPVSILLFIGLALGWANAPWRKRPRVPMGAFADALGKTITTSAD